MATVSKKPVATTKKLPKLSAKQQNIFLGMFVGLIGAVQIALSIQPSVGLFVNTLVFIALIAIALTKERFQKLAVLLAIFPAAMMVNLIVPATNYAIRLFVYYGVLFILGALYKYVLLRGQSFARSKINSDYKLLGGVIVGGIVIGLLGFLLLQKDYPFVDVSLGVAIIACIFFALTEEILFRGLIQEQAAKLFSADYAILLVAFLYTVLSFSVGIIWAPIVAFISAFALSTLYGYKPNLIVTITANFAMKLTFIALMGIFIS